MGIEPFLVFFLCLLHSTQVTKIRSFWSLTGGFADATTDTQCVGRSVRKYCNA